MSRPIDSSDHHEPPADRSGDSGVEDTGRGGWGRLARNMVFYTVLRLMLFIAILLVIIGIGRLVDVDVPVLVAGIIALVIALPLSMVLFTRMRAEINSDIAAVSENRREEKAALRRRMQE